MSPTGTNLQDLSKLLMWRGLEPKPRTTTTDRQLGNPFWLDPVVADQHHQVPSLSSSAHSLQTCSVPLATQPRAKPGRASQPRDERVSAGQASRTPLGNPFWLDPVGVFRWTRRTCQPRDERVSAVSRPCLKPQCGICTIKPGHQSVI